MNLSVSRNALVAINNVRTLYGANARSKVVPDARGQWLWKVQDRRSLLWHTELVSDHATCLTAKEQYEADQPDNYLY